MAKPARDDRAAPNPVVAVLQTLPFTTAAVAARQSFDLLDNFATRCEPEGMPRLMFNPHPFEFIDRPETLALRAELYDQERMIHMNRAEPPPGERSSGSATRWVAGKGVTSPSRPRSSIGRISTMWGRRKARPFRSSSAFL